MIADRVNLLRLGAWQPPGLVGIPNFGTAICGSCLPFRDDVELTGYRFYKVGGIRSVPDLPRILVYGGKSEQAESLAAAMEGRFLPIRAERMEDALELLRGRDFAGVLLLNCQTAQMCDASLFPQAGGILSQIPDGLVILNLRLKIVWTNRRFDELAHKAESPIGLGFFEALGAAEIMGPEYSPFHTALGTGTVANSTVKLGEKVYLQVTATPISSADCSVPAYLVVSVRDVSAEVLQQQKLSAIYQAGLELGDLSPADLLDMSVQDRVELVKSRIIHYTKDLLEFETVEIRLLDEATQRLDPLLTVGMVPEAETRELYARPQGNGVTGFVASTGKSYLCEDTTHDPLYLIGAANARSSLTVPLFLHDKILGTFNVESTHAGAFDENDLQFLELFSREVAVALNTLELLVAEKVNVAAENIEAILREVANPVDEILNDTTWILEKYIGHDPSVGERLMRILKRTRDIRSEIHKVGEAIIPEGAGATLPSRAQRPKLRGKRILVVDNDELVRRAAHELLGRHGCEVETAHNGEESLLMVRSFQYDAVLVDIRLPDMSGYDCFCQIRESQENLPVILMTGFGYDPGHSIVKARQQGLKSVLYKPFRVEQLLDEVEKTVNPHGAAIVNQGDTAGTTAPAPTSQSAGP
jgi:CheY-like chemotaxis protein